MTGHADAEPVGRIPARVAARVSGLASMRAVAKAMVQSGIGAVLVENPTGPVGLVTAKDIIEAVAEGADPDIVWAGEIMRATPRVVSCDQHPAEIGEEMAAYELEIVAVVDKDAAMGVATALDVLGALVRVQRSPRRPEPPNPKPSA